MTNVVACPAPEIIDDSLRMVVLVTFHPSLTVPTTLAAGMRTSLKNTSLKWATPCACTSGRTSMPGVRMSTMKYVMPLCLGTDGSVRQIRMPKSACCAEEFQTFCPLTTHSSPSRTARVPRVARSLPASGSLNS